jgi:V/A-type H+-transporting ATPase subunit D
VAKKIKLTRPELKRQRDALSRYQRYLPMLKLKQQQLQATVRQIAQRLRKLQDGIREVQEAFKKYDRVLADLAGLSVEKLAEPDEVQTSTSNIAGVEIPIFEDISFSKATYSLFGTPPWVDQALADLRERNRRQAEYDIVARQHELLSEELSKIIQRVNLFEKVKIPEAQEAIRVIRIKLGDEMTAGVARAKIAKSKLAETMETEAAEAGPWEEEENGESPDWEGDNE